jgi:glycosyltransferase involved in cell wall biosynthesis
MGVLPHSKAHLFYKDIHALVVPSQTTPSWREQFGRTIVEAVASGRPVIGSSSGSIPEVMDKLSMPYLFNEKSAQDLGDAILKLKNDIDSGAITSIINRAVPLCEKQFSTKAVAARLMEIWNEVRISLKE